MSTKNISIGTQKIQLKKFNINNMHNHATIAMIAKRASGKSFLTKEILYHNRHIPSCIAISKTEKLNTFYGDFIPDIYIYDNFDTSILTRIYKRQALLNEENKKRVKAGKKEKDDRLMLIMDDCMSSKGSWIKDPNILELFFNGRHHHISFILTMQFSLGIPPEMRSNFDYIFLLAEDFISNRKRLYDHYAGMFPSFDIFQQIFMEVTDNYGVLVIDNRVHSKDITKKVFWYKAKETPEFKMGSRRYKKYHKKNYDKKYNSINNKPDLSLLRKKNNYKILVEKIK